MSNLPAEIKSAGFSWVNICMDTNTQPQETAPEIPAMTLQDLMALKSVVEAAAARGAFRAEEMTNIGTLYDKLANFLKAITMAEPPAEPVEDQPQGE